MKESKTVAVVGLSPKEDRPSYRVASYLKSVGYRIIPVNPNVSEVLGERSYADLGSVRERIDVVDIFRKSEDVPSIVDEAIKLRAHVWMQEGIVNDQAAMKARAAGLLVVMDRCMLKEHKKLSAVP